MGTGTTRPSLGEALFGKARRQLLSLFYGDPEQEYFVRQILRATGMGQGAIQRELAHLHEARILLRERRGKQVFYRANPDCPAFEELRSLVQKTWGTADIVRDALRRLGEGVQVAFLFRSEFYREELPEDRLDLLVVGSVGFGEVVEALGPVEDRLACACNATVYEPDEFQRVFDEGNEFLHRIMSGDRKPVIGNPDFLAM